MADQPPLRLLTWNIHRGFGPDRRCDLPRIVALIRRHRPDIVALQEVDSRARWGQEGAYSFLLESLGSHAVEAKAITAPDGDYGHMLISKHPLTDIRLHDLSVLRREPRRAIEATVQTPDGPLRLIAAHLGLLPGERRHQGAILAARARAGPHPTIVLGDFNDWRRNGPVTLALSREMPGRTEHRTFPARLPLGRLDRIYCWPASMMVRSWTDREARHASDHLPIIAEIAVAEPERG